MRLARSTGVALVLLALAGCDSIAGGGDGGTEPALLPGTIEVFRHDGEMLVRDGARDGVHVALLVEIDRVGPNVRLVLLSSHDGGASFVAHDLPPVPYPGQAVGVHVAGTRTLVVANDDSGSSFHPFDPSAPEGYGAPVTLGPWPLAFDGAAVTGVRLGGGRLEYARIDAVTLERTSSEAPFADENCEWQFVSADGRTFRRWCYTIDERCVHTVETQPTGVEIGRSCVPASAWPIPQTTRQHPILAGGDVWMSWFEAGHTFATRIETADVVAPTVDLGGGIEYDLLLRSLHPRWGGLVRLASDAGEDLRFVALSRDGTASEVGLATHACADPSACSNSLLQWLMPSEPGAWLAVYQVGERLVVRTARDGEAPPGDPRWDLPADRLPIEPLLATSELEAACARVTSCLEGMSLPECIDYWLPVRGATPEGDGAYHAFVGTPSGDCAAFSATFREHPGLWPCETGCFDDVAVRCGVPPIDCRLRGTTCRVTAEGLPTCGDPAGVLCDRCDGGRAVVCADLVVPIVSDCSALGLECFEDDGPLRLAALCSPGVGAACGGPFCVEGVASTCLEDSRAIDERLDCRRAGLGCRGGRCDLPRGTDPVCLDDSVSQCEGPYLVHCRGSAWHAIDCRELGHSGCEEPATGSPRCSD